MVLRNFIAVVLLLIPSEAAWVSQDATIDYRRATEDVITKVMKQAPISAEQFRITEFELLMPPDHARLHLRHTASVSGPGQIFATVSGVPIARVAVDAGGNRIMHAAVHFAAGEPYVNFGVDYTDFWAAQPGEVEWHQATRELAPFWLAALNISQGHERFDPFLNGADLASLPWTEMSGRQLSEQEARLFMSLLLDFSAHQVWLDFERLPRMSLPERTPSSFEEAIKEVQATIAIATSRLKLLGALEEKHFDLVARQIRAEMGEGVVKKWVFTPPQEPASGGSLNWQPGTTFYVVETRGYPNVTAYFRRVNGRLLIAAFEID